MFDFIHRHKRLLQVVLGLVIIPPFAFWGIQSYESGSSQAGDVASVAGSRISQQEFAKQLQSQQERMRGMLGGRIDPAIFDTPEAREQVLNGLIMQRLMTEDVIRQKLAVTDENLRETIASQPAFQDNGKFSPERYQQALLAEGYTPPQFEAGLRRDLMAQQLGTAVADSAIVSRAVAKQWALIAGEQREISQASVPASAFASQVKATPEAVQSFYEANKKSFELPEQAHVQFVVLSGEVLAALDSVKPEEIKAQYDARRDQYEQKEQRQASHILVTVKSDALEADKAKVKAKAEQIAAQVKKNPASFAEVAKKESQDPGSAPKGGDLGFFSRGMMVPQFEDAVFRMKEGEIAGPVQSDFGYHIIRLTAIKAGKIKPFEEVRGEIEREIRKQRASKKFAEYAEQFSNVVYEQPDSLQPAADKFKLQIQDAGWVTRAQSRVPQLNNPRLLSVLFSEDSIKNKRNSEAIEIAPGTLVSARIVEYKAATVRALDEVRGEVVQQLVRKESAALAWKEGEAKLAELKKGSGEGLSFSTTKVLGREGAQGVPPDETTAAFRVDTTKLPAYTGVQQADGYLIVRVSRIVPPAMDETKEKGAQTELARIQGAEQFQAYVAARRADTKVEVNKAALQKKEQ